MASRGAALITGGARRIGRALVTAAADAGFDVAIHVRSVGRRGRGRRRRGARAGPQRPPSSSATCARNPPPSPWWAEAEAELGPVTLLVNSASVFEEDAFSDMNRASWDVHMETNLPRAPGAGQAFARRLPADREGLIVNIIDQRVLNPTPEFFSYSLSKAALWDATRMLAQDLAPRVRVNGIGPGPTLPSVHQDQAAFDAEARATLMGRPVPLAEIGLALRYLIDATAVTGQLIAVDSGQHLA